MELKEMPIHNLPLPTDALAKLQSLGVRSAYDLVLLAYLEEQRELLSEHLGLPRAELDALLDELLRDAPTEAIERLASRAREIRRIPSGLLPPDGEDPDENAAGPSEESGGNDVP